MLSKAVGAVSILYFLYGIYMATAINGPFAIISILAVILYSFPYLLAGIFLLQDGNKTLAIIMGLLIFLIPFYLGGLNIAIVLQNITNPVYLIFTIVLPALIIYCALRE